LYARWWCGESGWYSTKFFCVIFWVINGWLVGFIGLLIVFLHGLGRCEWSKSLELFSRRFFLLFF
jgi:hypothetical protein